MHVATIILSFNIVWSGLIFQNYSYEFYYYDTNTIYFYTNFAPSAIRAVLTAITFLLSLRLLKFRL